jgi:hypothetical protein
LKSDGETLIDPQTELLNLPHSNKSQEDLDIEDTEHFKESEDWANEMILMMQRSNLNGSNNSRIEEMKQYQKQSQTNQSNDSDCEP